mmetsp:Transcript_21962/g.32958  ORF Transcript_21962/g.32958 Transcript_21962/m.32958 type:complete len:204 (+) Transcript_21962:284-895(+)
MSSVSLRVVFGFDFGSIFVAFWPKLLITGPPVLLICPNKSSMVAAGGATCSSSSFDDFSTATSIVGAGAGAGADEEFFLTRSTGRSVSLPPPLTGSDKLMAIAIAKSSSSFELSPPTPDNSKFPPTSSSSQPHSSSVAVASGIVSALLLPEPPTDEPLSIIVGIEYPPPILLLSFRLSESHVAKSVTTLIASSCMACDTFNDG